MTRAALPVVLALAALTAFGANVEPDALLAFSEAEVRRIMAHGPWPPPRERDPSNRVSGNAAAIAWGAQLFREPRLSANGAVSCASCHQAPLGFSDGLPKARGLAPVDRNTPSVANTRMQRWYGWDGAGWVKALTRRPTTTTTMAPTTLYQR